jgi:uncharacterized protein
MTRWVAIFEDHPRETAAWVRDKHADDHFAYLAANAEKIRIGGGLRPAPGAWFSGGLWVLEVESRDEAVRLVEDDPYFKLGLRKSYQLYVWGTAAGYGDVVL